MRTLKAWPASSLLFLLMACGTKPAASTGATTPKGDDKKTPTASTPSTAGTVDNAAAVGGVNDYVLKPRSSASATFSGDYNALLLVVSNQADYCGATTAQQTHANHVAFVAQLITVTADGNTAEVTPGTYKVVDEVPQMAGNYALGAFRASDQSCNDMLTSPDDTATDGAVTLKALDSSSASGSYDATFAHGAVKGDFAAAACPALAQQANDGGELTCEP